MPKPEVLSLPGVNLQSMDPTVSGDAVLWTSKPNFHGDRLLAVADGAWVKGYEHPVHAPDIAHWASNTFLNNIAEAFPNPSPKPQSLTQLITSILPLYRSQVEDLRRKISYTAAPPAPFQDINLAKIGPQCTFAMVRFLKDGTLEIAQVRDTLVVLETKSGSMQNLTPNQSEKVEQATRTLNVQHESLSRYSKLAEEIILGGQWSTRRREVATAARKVHKPEFFSLWKQQEATLPESLNGPEGLTQWNETLEMLCLCQNSWYFLNRPEKPPSWAMLTGEETMLPLMFTRTLSRAELQNARAIWIVTDGAFRQGDRGADLRAMRRLGLKDYYRDVLLKRFNNSSPSRMRFSKTRIPGDVTIVKLPMEF